MNLHKSRIQGGCKRNVGAAALCTTGGKTEGILVILRAREFRNYRHSITVQRTRPFWDWKAQQAHLRKMMMTGRGFSDVHLRRMREHCRETDHRLRERRVPQ